MSFRLTPTNTGASNSRASTASAASAASTTSTASVLAASLAAGAVSVSATVAAAWSACGRRVRTTKSKLRRRLSASKGRAGGVARTHSRRRRAGPYWSLDSGARQSVVIYLGEDEAGASDRGLGPFRGGGDDDIAKVSKKGFAAKDRVVVRSYAVSAEEDDDDDDVDDDSYFSCCSSVVIDDGLKFNGGDYDCCAYTWTNEASRSKAAAAVASALAAYRTVAGPDDYDANWI